MPDIESTIFTLLAEDLGVIAIVDTKIYPLVVPQGSDMPAITYQQITDRPEYTCGGPATLTDYTIQVNAWAASFSECCDLRNAIRNAVSGYSGVIGGIKVHSIFITDVGDMPTVSSTVGKEQRTRYGKRIDLQIWLQN